MKKFVLIISLLFLYPISYTQTFGALSIDSISVTETSNSKILAEITKELIISKSGLEKKGTLGKKYIKVINDFTLKNSSNTTRLKEILRKIYPEISNIENNSGYGNNTTYLVLKYLSHKLEYNVLKTDTVNSNFQSGETFESISVGIKADIKVINLKIANDILIGNVTITDLVKVEEESTYNSSIGLIYGGIPNYYNLYYESEDFKNPYNIPYIIRYTGNIQNPQYEVIGIMKISNGDWEVFIDGNYYQKNNGDPIGLFIHPKTGKFLKNGDIIDKEDLKVN